MKIKFWAFFLLMAACQSSGGSLPLASQVFSYPTQDKQYVILVPMEPGVTNAQAQKQAMEKASQVTLQNGYSYFTVVSQGSVDLAATSSQQQEQMPSNIYEELIQHRRSAEPVDKNTASVVPVYKLVIECYSEKPPGKKSYSVNEISSQ